jgi:hypothetical protein
MKPPRSPVAAAAILQHKVRSCFWGKKKTKAMARREADHEGADGLEGAEDWDGDYEGSKRNTSQRSVGRSFQTLLAAFWHV